MDGNISAVMMLMFCLSSDGWCSSWRSRRAELGPHGSSGHGGTQYKHSGLTPFGSIIYGPIGTPDLLNSLLIVDVFFLVFVSWAAYEAYGIHRPQVSPSIWSNVCSSGTLWNLFYFSQIPFLFLFQFYFLKKKNVSN